MTLWQRVKRWRRLRKIGWGSEYEVGERVWWRWDLASMWRDGTVDVITADRLCVRVKYKETVWVTSDGRWVKQRNNTYLREINSPWNIRKLVPAKTEGPSSEGASDPDEENRPLYDAAKRLADAYGSNEVAIEVIDEIVAAMPPREEAS
jgi:hypothetical protein